MVKNLPVNAGDTSNVGSSLDEEDPLEEGMAIHSIIVACTVLRTEEPVGLQSMESQRLRPN